MQVPQMVFGMGQCYSGRRFRYHATLGQNLTLRLYRLKNAKTETYSFRPTALWQSQKAPVYSLLLLLCSSITVTWGKSLNPAGSQVLIFQWRRAGIQMQFGSFQSLAQLGRSYQTKGIFVSLCNVETFLCSCQLSAKQYANFPNIKVSVYILLLHVLDILRI